METGLVNYTSQTAGQSGTTKKASSTLDKNAFLSLLVAQLQNQDPTSAQDPNQMVQQMTSFSTLEQMQNMNTALQGIQTQNYGIFEAQSANLVGKKVQVTSSSLDLKDGKATVGINIASDANVSITIKDSNGKIVNTLDQGSQTAGDHVISWDGRDSDGNKLTDGTYTVSISAKDNAGKEVTARTSAFVTVDAVTFTNGQVMVMAGGKSFPTSDITSISA